MQRFDGHCLCGQVPVCFDSSRSQADAVLRHCTCSFCVRHRALYITDARGSLALIASDASAIKRYPFDGGTAMAVVCSRCGTYLGAVLETAEGDRCALNARSLSARELLSRDPEPLDYDAEDDAARTLRRRAEWTPLHWQWTAA